MLLLLGWMLSFLDVPWMDVADSWWSLDGWWKAIVERLLSLCAEFHLCAVHVTFLKAWTLKFNLFLRCCLFFSGKQSVLRELIRPQIFSIQSLQCIRNCGCAVVLIAGCKLSGGALVIVGYTVVYWWLGYAIVYWWRRDHSMLQHTHNHPYSTAHPTAPSTPHNQCCTTTPATNTPQHSKQSPTHCSTAPDPEPTTTLHSSGLHWPWL